MRQWSSEQATTGQTITYSGLFGPLGLNYFNPNTSNAIDTSNLTGYTYAQEHLLGNLLVSNGGVLTVPLAQIVASGNIAIPSQWAGGIGTFLEFGRGRAPSNNGTYNVLGGPATTDPGHLDYATNQIVGGGVPEPSTLILAAPRRTRIAGVATAGVILAAWFQRVPRRTDEEGLLKTPKTGRS